MHADIKQGKKIYTERCVLCHGLAGEGWDWKKKAAKPPVPVPNLQEVIPERTDEYLQACLLYTSPSPRDRTRSRMPSSA